MKKIKYTLRDYDVPYFCLNDIVKIVAKEAGVTPKHLLMGIATMQLQKAIRNFNEYKSMPIMNDFNVYIYWMCIGPSLFKKALTKEQYKKAEQTIRNIGLACDLSEMFRQPKIVVAKEIGLQFWPVDKEGYIYKNEDVPTIDFHEWQPVG